MRIAAPAYVSFYLNKLAYTEENPIISMLYFTRISEKP